MKKTFLISLILILSYGIIPAQGINFEHTSFKEVLEKAKKENKAVFMDCYTSWCGPCKALSNNIFPQKIVGDYFNENFVNFKIDMEKGEGPDLAKKYNVQAFPTLLFLDQNGKILHLIVGYAEAETLIAEAKKATNSEMSFGAMQDKYKAGERSYAFLSKYLSELENNGMYDEMEVLAKDFYQLVKTTDYLNPEVIEIIQYIGLEYGSEEYFYYIQNKNAIIATTKISEKAYDNILDNTIYNHLYPLSEGKSLSKLENEIEKCKAEYTCLDQLDLEFSLISEYHYINKQYKKWYNYFVETAEIYKKKDEKLGREAYLSLLYDIALDQEIFKSAGLTDKGIGIAKQLLKENPNMTEVYGCLAEFYLFKKNKAEAEKAINIYMTKLGDKATSYDKDLKAEIDKM